MISADEKGSVITVEQLLAEIHESSQEIIEHLENKEFREAAELVEEIETKLDVVKELVGATENG